MNITQILFLLTLLFPTVIGRTQVCTGSLGDPVVNITFGTGPNPGPSLPASRSSYIYSEKDCPIDGEYTIRNLTFLCNTDTWYTVPFDHTPGDGSNGYFMEINGGDQPDYYVNALTGLCPNTTYELSFWIMNISKSSACSQSSIDPNIKFNIENSAGGVIASATTGNIAKKTEATWNQFTLLFKTSALTTVVLRLSNNGVSGCGMDFLLDDITVRPCGPSIVASIAQNGALSGKGCEEDATPILLSATVGTGFVTPVYQWQESINGGATWTDIVGATSPGYLRRPTAKGNYHYRVLVGEAANATSPQCRLSSNAVNIVIDRAPFAQGTNYSYCLGQDVTLFAAGGEKYRWTGPNNFASDKQSPIIPNVQFSDSGLYRVEVTTSVGCKGTDSTRLTIFTNPVAVVNPDVSICEGSSTRLSASGGIKYHWIPSKTLSSDSVSDPVAKPLDSTVYIVQVFRNGCYDTASVRVNVWKKPVANAGPDRRLRKGQKVSLSGSAKGTDVKYFWTPSLFMSNATILNPIINTSENIQYTLHVESNKGCGSSTDDVLVKVYENIKVPNAFSPNGDGINDVWNIEPLELFDDSETQVYNRYGQLVYQSHGYGKPWDGTRNGKHLPAGIYYYAINLKDGKPSLTGSVLIIR